MRNFLYSVNGLFILSEEIGIYLNVPFIHFSFYEKSSLFSFSILFVFIYSVTNFTFFNLIQYYHRSHYFIITLK